MALCVNCRAHGSMVEAFQKAHGEVSKVMHHAKNDTLSFWWDALGEQINAFINAANFVIDCSSDRCDSHPPIKPAPKPSEVAGE